MAIGHLDEPVAPASQLIGAALPAGLVWERGGRRATSTTFAAAALAALAVLGWQRLAAEPSAAEPLVRQAVAGGQSVAASARAAGQVAERIVDAAALPVTGTQVADAARAAGQVAVAAAESRLVVPLAQVDEWTHRHHTNGEASYYASGFEGRSTASGEPYRAAELTAAHRTLPFGTVLRVTNVRNGRSVVVRVNDRGPFHPRRVVDLSRAAAAEIGLVRRGRGPVRLDVLSR